MKKLIANKITREKQPMYPLRKNIGQVEIVREKQTVVALERVFFPIPPICKFLSEKSKMEFSWKVCIFVR